MKKPIKTVYVVHHSHMDVGFTDLQERIIDVQIDNIRSVLNIMENPKYQGFRWTCETYFCVERFLAEASAEEKERFFALAKEGRIGISANYLNFCDLVDSAILSERTHEMAKLFSSKGTVVKTAMNADVNGISLGQRDALMDAGVEFLYTNVNTHHGMYAMYQNQKAYWWKAENGKKLLVWNGEHYHLGNHIGIRPYIYRAKDDRATNIEILHKNLQEYIAECEGADLQNDFIVLGVSGELSDNAPPNALVLDIINEYNAAYGQTKLVMVTLQELYQELLKHLQLDKLPVVSGDLTDWWANGVGSTPLAVKHYRGAQRMFHLSAKAVPQSHTDNPQLKRAAEDNLLLYAEHTWGHSSSTGNPYDTLVSDLDIRKTAYASNAHEASALLLNRAIKSIGGDFKHFNLEGQVKAIYPGAKRADMLVEFHVETPFLYDAAITDENGGEVKSQTTSHSRGTKISFIDSFNPGESKQYSYKCIQKEPKKPNSRYAYVGTENAMDIVNDYEPDYYQLPHKLENEWFRIEYEVGTGFTSLYDKQNNRELIVQGMENFFTPIYEKTKIGEEAWVERSKLGRNIRGIHATQMKGSLSNVQVVDKGCLYTQVKFSFAMDGVKTCYLYIKLYKGLPRIEFKLGLAKQLSDDIESIYLPLSLQRCNNEAVYLKKGAKPFMPGVDQIPGTCMEYWMTDTGVAYFDKANQKGVLIHTPDTPLIYMGELKHHPITLCDGKLENNYRPVYSWIMNNTWETNFKIDLSGFGEYSYALELVDAKTPEECFERLEDSHLGVLSCLLKQDR